MNARYAGTCRKCSRRYSAGTSISRDPKFGWVCCGSSARPASSGAPAQAAFEVRATPADKLHPVALLIVRTTWDWAPREAVTAAIKSIPGRRWVKESKSWSLPAADGERLATLVERAAPALAASIRALPVVHEAMQAKADALAASRAATVDADVVASISAPEGQAYLPFQAAGIAYAMERTSTLIGDEMGLGKTVQALGVANAVGAKRILVVAPASLRINWRREAEKWLVGGQSVGVVETNTLPETDVVILSYQRVVKTREQIDSRTWDLVVFDEAHYLKSHKSQRTIACLGDGRERPAIKAARTLVLTGTPIPNRPIELWPLLRTFDRGGLGRSWKFFATQYCGAYRGSYGWDVKGSSNLDELQERLRSSLMIRRKKADVLKELPAKRRQVVVLPPNGASRAVKSEQKALATREAAALDLAVAVELAKVADDDDAYEAAVAALHHHRRTDFTEMASSRRKTAVAKVPAVVEHVTDMLEGGGVDKVVLFAHHHEVVAGLAAGLCEYGVATLTGESDYTERDDAVQAFQNDADVRVFIGSIQAAGVGLTLTAASTVLFAELDWVPGNMSQAEDRCHRIGQTNSVLVQHIVLDGTIDATLAQSLVEKQNVIDNALDAEQTEEDRKARADADADTAGALGAVAEEAFEAARKVNAYSVCREATRDKLAVEASLLDDAKVAAVHEALRQIAGVCDGASARDGQGFNKLDTNVGKSLANENSLSPRQAALGMRLARRYRRQVDAATLAVCGIEVAK